jgi:hypothetical protein
MRELKASGNVSFGSKSKPSTSPPNPPFRSQEKQADLLLNVSGVAFKKEEKEVAWEPQQDPAPGSGKQTQTGVIMTGPPSFHDSELSQRASTPSIRIETAPSPSPAVYTDSNVLVKAEPPGMVQDQVSRPSSAPGSTHDTPPPPPSVIDLGEQITVLTAKLEELRLRYNAVNESIHEITKHEVPIHPTASAQVEMERQKLKALREELGDIKKQEQDFGLQLNKAWEILDPVPQYGPLISPLRRGITS